VLVDSRRHYSEIATSSWLGGQHMAKKKKAKKAAKKTSRKKK
jgi:hypothetical protein